MLHWFIAPNKSTFVTDCLLLENLLLATELVKDYHKDTISTRSTIKIDIDKSFDTVHWDFIVVDLRALNFPEIFIR